MKAVTRNAARRGTGLNPLFVALCTLVLIIGASGQAQACTISAQYGPAVDKPIVVNENGSFEFAGDDRAEFFDGRRVADIHRGLVVQRVIASGGCSSSETLLVADCNNGHAAFIRPVLGPNDGDSGYIDLKVDSLLAPKGALRLGKMDFFEILAVAEKHGYGVDSDALGKIRKMKKKNRFDPFWGCKKFYPESFGARKKL